MSTGFALVCVDRFIKVLRFSMSTFALFLSSSCVSCFSMSTGFEFVFVDRFKVLRFSMSIFALFPVYMSTGLCNYGVMFFYVVIFNPDVYFMTCKKIFDINHAFYSHNRSYMDLTNLQVRNYIWQIHSKKTMKIIHNQYENGNVFLHYRNFNPALDSFDTY